jgi:hypothetical protein
VSAWRSPEAILALGFERSRIVMVNEFHDGMRHCARTRSIGRRLLPVAHACGVRHLAMEALGGPYVDQPDLRALIDDAIALGWELLPYEDTSGRDPHLSGGGVDWGAVNERELGQARNLVAVLPETPLLVWCGNSHLSKRAGGEFTPMGMLFGELSGIDPFALDQTVTIFDRNGLVERMRGDLEPLGGTAGKLTSELPPQFCRDDVDALLFSVDNVVA